MTMTFQTQFLRKKLRQQRRKLNRYDQFKAEMLCARQLFKHPKFISAKKVGIYLNAFGEVATELMIEKCFSLRKEVYLPIICNMNQRLYWVKISSHLYRNRRFCRHALGMLEPMASRGEHVSHLDLLVMPLLACDRIGTRMGMGGGFYDRTLATAPHHPYRLGIGHHFQYIDDLFVRQPWDQPLDSFISPKHCYYFKHTSI